MLQLRGWKLRNLRLTALAGSFSMLNRMRIATRGSKLALWQAEHIAGRIRARHPDREVELKVVKTSGDVIRDAPLANYGGKGLFVKEIEEVLLRGEAELAVHSMKDIPSQIPEGLTLGVVPERGEAADCFLSQAHPNLDSLPREAVVGTSSLRRQAQLLALRPDLSIRNLRGNLDTRLGKLREGEYQAIIAASIGLRRLGLSADHEKPMLSEEFLPAVGQGCLGLQYLQENREVESLIAFLDHPPSRLALEAERSLLQRLEGGCQTPIGGHAYLTEDGSLILRALVADIDGKEVVRSCHSSPAEDAGRLGREVADELLASGGGDILRRIQSQQP